MCVLHAVGRAEAGVALFPFRAPADFNLWEKEEARQPD